MINSLANRLFSNLVLVACVLLLGTCGYALLEGWSLFDGLYMTIITFSTVGYGETQDLSTTGRAFTSMLILSSMVIMIYWSAGITSNLVSADISGALLKRKTMNMISKMRDHSIVCGSGIFARTVIDGLIREGKPVVAVMTGQTEIDLLRRMYPSLLIIEGDPKDEMNLADANLLKASNLIAAMESDYDNLLITITGKTLGTKLSVFSCALNTELASRMMKVGADQVICPMVLGGEHLKSLICAGQTPEIVPSV